MSLTAQYLNQYRWRDWQRALSMCPIRPGHRILDLGCGPGSISGALAARGALVLGIDHNVDLLAAARQRHPDCVFEQQDLRDLRLPLAAFDGLWCSFTAAYFLDFERVLTQWRRHLKPSAWICITEVDDLLNHEPLSESAHRALARFYEDASVHGRYDFRAGGKLATILKSTGLNVRTFQLNDREFAFEGPATPEIFEAWRLRLQRMVHLQAHLGDDYLRFETEFLGCLKSPDHRSLSTVVCCLGC